MKTKLILIGGVPGTGKTTLAYNLALRFKIDKVLSVDMIKNFAKAYDDSFDKYILTTTHDAYKLEQIGIIDGYLKHCRAVNSVVLKILSCIKDNIVIVEGTTINKEFIDMLDKNKYEISYLNLYLPKEKLLERYELKSKLRKSNWVDNIKVIEKLNEYLSIDNLCFFNNNLDKMFERIVEYVKKDLCL